MSERGDAKTITSEERIQCDRNGWKYDDYIRVRDMGIDMDDLAGLADDLTRLRAQVARLQWAIQLHNREDLRVTVRLDDMGKLPPLAASPIREELYGLQSGDLDPLEDA